jgi:signal transduction histidine kinase
MEAKTRALSSIAEAKIALDRALAELDTIRTFDPALVGAVAHAISNYITVTVATVEMLQMTLSDYPKPDIPVWLEGIRHATELMQHSVGRLVTVSTPRDFPLKLDFVNLPVLIERACEYYRRRAEADAIRITCRSVGHIPFVWADRVVLAVVAENLLSNAVQFSRRHGTIEVQIVPEPGYVVCKVRDSGPGLTPEQLRRVFERQVPVNPPAQTDARVGYGLAIANEFVLRMKGNLWGESEVGHGACFSFRLPAAE